MVRSLLARRAAGQKGIWREDVLIAHVDQVLPVFACAQPEFTPRMLDRMSEQMRQLGLPET